MLGSNDLRECYANSRREQSSESVKMGNRRAAQQRYVRYSGPSAASSAHIGAADGGAAATAAGSDVRRRQALPALDMMVREYGI